LAYAPGSSTLHPFKFRDNYSAASNNMKLVHWPLMGGPLYWDSEEGTGRDRSPPRPVPDSSEDVKSRNDVPFGVIKLKFNIRPLFISKTVKFWRKMGVAYQKTMFWTKIAGAWVGEHPKTGSLIVSATDKAINFKFGIRLEFGE